MTLKEWCLLKAEWYFSLEEKYANGICNEVHRAQRQFPEVDFEPLLDAIKELPDYCEYFFKWRQGESLPRGNFLKAFAETL